MVERGSFLRIEILKYHRRKIISMTLPDWQIKIIKEYYADPKNEKKDHISFIDDLLVKLGLLI